MAECTKKEIAKPEKAAASQQRGGSFFKPVVQPKLSVNQPNDPFEQEADATADKVMRMADVSIQRKCHHCEEEEKKAQRKETGGESATAPTQTESYINNLSGGRGLSQNEKSFFEPRMGYDFSNVRIHTGAEAAQSAASINALAYTTGNNIVFNDGQYAPGTDSGKRLIAHELTHVVQQNAGIQTKMIQRAENDSSVGCTGLTDTAPDINAKVNSELAAIKTATAAAKVAGIRGGIGSDMWTSPGRTQIEGWAVSLPATKAFQPAQAATKYKDVTYRLWSNPAFPILNPTMKVNGVCIGSDKLGHFFQQGHEYYQAEHATGGSVADAIAGGQSQEAGGYGLKTTGVYSNADLAANLKGMNFYDDLTASPGMTFDIAKYIDSSWSEVENPNYYESSVGPTVWKNLLTGDWSGAIVDPAIPNTKAVTVKLTVAANATDISGTITQAGGITGTLKGKVTPISTIVPGPSKATAISGVTINFDWILGTDSGTGIWTNVKENELHGDWSPGLSNTGSGTWNMKKN